MSKFFNSMTVVLILHAANAVACINEYGTSLDGAAKIHSTRRVPLSVKIDRQHYQKQIATLTARVKKSADFKELSDLAVAHLYVGETERAIELLEQAEKLHPNEYIIAANLGTAYELAGRNADALKWIEEGVRRNPDSHGGSEWVHVNLLRAKISMENDADWIAANSVTGLEFGNDALPVYDADASAANCPRVPEYVQMHLVYQLHERRKFIPGADPVVAALMFDLANATAVTDTVEGAIPIYQAARELGYHDTALLDRRVAAMELLQRGNLLSGWTYESIAKWIIGSLLVLIIVLMIVKAFNSHRKMPDSGLPTEVSG